MVRIAATVHSDQYTFMIISRSVHFRIRNVSDKSCSITFSKFSPKIVTFMTYVEKKAEATDDNMAHALCMPDN